jgi:hypothetical protein
MYYEKGGSGKIAISVIPAKAGIQNALKNRIPGRAPLARNDDFLHFSRVLQEAQGICLSPFEFRKFFAGSQGKEWPEDLLTEPLPDGKVYLRSPTK